jgi:DNA primase
VVEGYTDVIGLVQAGVEATVATCGTALGERHFELLSRFGQRAVLAFDSDEAGARAAERAFAFHERFAIQPVVMIMPEGLDPAELVAKHGPEAVREAAATARPLVEYMVRRIVRRHDLGTIEGQSAAVADALPLLENLQDPVRRSEYAHLLADLAGVAESSVLQSLERRLGGRPQEVAKTVKRSSAHERVEREMLRLVAREPELWGEYADRLTDEHFRAPSNRRVFDALRQVGGDVTALASGTDEKLAASASQLVVELIEGEPTPEYAAGVFARLHGFVLKARSDTLRVQLQKMNPVTEPGYDDLFRRLVAVDGELRAIRQMLQGADLTAPHTPPDHSDDPP